MDDQVLAGARLHTTTLHGCRPASAHHTVARATGPVILEIDHQPATDVVARIVGADSGLAFEDYGWFITFGVNRSDDHRGGPTAKKPTPIACAWASTTSARAW